MAEAQAFSQEVLMQTGYYVHLFLYSPHESGGHILTNSIEVVCACIFVIRIYILTSYAVDRPGQDVKLSEEEGRSDMAGRARSSALQNFGTFPDSGMVYTPHRPKIAGYLSTKEILHTGMASQKPKLGVRRGRGVKLLIKLFFPRGFLMRLVSMYVFSLSAAMIVMPMSSYD